jgi:hypothetical protein
MISQRQAKFMIEPLHGIRAIELHLRDESKCHG